MLPENDYYYFVSDLVLWYLYMPHPEHIGKSFMHWYKKFHTISFSSELYNCNSTLRLLILPTSYYFAALELLSLRINHEDIYKTHVVIDLQAIFSYSYTLRSYSYITLCWVCFSLEQTKSDLLHWKWNAK